MKELLALAINGADIPVPKSLPQPETGMTAKIIGNSLEIFIIAGIAVSVAMIAWGGIQWGHPEIVLCFIPPITHFTPFSPAIFG